MIAQRKRPVIRVGPRLAGFPPDEPIPSVAPQPSAIVQTQEIVSRLMEAVADAQTEEEVKHAVQDTFTPAQPPAPVKRGRPPKFKSDEERKQADADRKKKERSGQRERERHAQLADRTGVDYKGSRGEVSGGYGSRQISQNLGRQQAETAILSAPHNDGPQLPASQLSDGFLATPDRKRSLPVGNPDNSKPDFSETDSTHSNLVMRREAASLHRWIHGQQKKACTTDHAGIAERHRDSRRKVYCGKCRKLLVNPGKPVKGVSVRDSAGNIVVQGISRTPDLKTAA
jgi:hypothetical protein